MSDPGIQIWLKRSQWEALYRGCTPGAKLSVEEWNARAKAVQQIRDELLALPKRDAA